jgi:hypothetical protein
LRVGIPMDRSQGNQRQGVSLYRTRAVYLEHSSLHCCSKLKTERQGERFKTAHCCLSKTQLIQGAGGPLKPSFGLSGAVPQLDTIFPPLVRAFAPSIPTRSQLVPRRQLRSDENCSTASPPDARTTQPSPDFDENSEASPLPPRQQKGIALRKLPRSLVVPRPRTETNL